MELGNSLGLLIVLLLVYVATLRGGVDSTDGVDTPERERRRDWQGLGGKTGR